MVHRVLVAAAFALVATTASAQTGTLSLYTSQPDQDARRTVDGFMAAVPGVKVEVFRSGTTEVLNKLQAEFTAGDARADVLLIADAMAMEILKRDGRLAAYPGAKTDGLLPGMADADKTYFGTKMITTGIVYNKQAPFVPTAWADLAKPEAAGRVVMPSPLYSGAAAIHVGTLATQPGLGWPYFETLSKAKAIAVRGNGQVLRSVATGERMFGVIVDFMALNEAAKGAPIAFVFPTEGVTRITEPVAILKAAKNPDAARAFVDFLISRAGQQLAAAMGYVSGAPDVAPPAVFPPMGAVKILSTPVDGLVKSDEATKQRFADLFGG